MKRAIIVLICLLFSFHLGQAGAQENHSTVNYSIYTGKPGDLAPPGFSCDSMGEGVECYNPRNYIATVKVQIFVYTDSKHYTDSKTAENYLKSLAYLAACGQVEHPERFRGTILNNTCSRDRVKTVSVGSVKSPIDPGPYNELVFKGDNYTEMYVQAGNVFLRLNTNGNARAIIQSFLSKIPTTLQQQPKANADDATRVGTIDLVKGAPTIIRGGVRTTLRTGDSLRIGDVIITGEHERVKIEFADGDFRVITQNSSIEFQEGDKNLNLTAVQKIFGSLECALKPDENLNPIVIGIRTTMTSNECAVTSAGSNNGILHVQHSRVRYEFNTVEDRVIVLEGRVESIDPRTKERVTTITGQQFTLKAGRPLRESIITSMGGATNQPWSRVPLQSEAEEIVRIQSVASSKCLDVPNLSMNDHVQIQQYSCREANDSLVKAQLWRLKNVNDFTQIQSVASDKCLDVPNLSTDDHIQIRQYACREANDSLVKAQLWKIKNVNGLTQFESVTSGKCLDVPNLSTDNNVIIQQYSCRGANDSLVNAQLWRLDKMR